MPVWPPTALFVALALGLITSLGRAQPDSPKHARTSDVIYGRKVGVALTMEVFTPAKPSGLGALVVVSSAGNSSRELTFDPSFERRIAPLPNHGYTI